jgi:hypothetical protein
MKDLHSPRTKAALQLIGLSPWLAERPVREQIRYVLVFVGVFAIFVGGAWLVKALG